MKPGAAYIRVSTEEQTEFSPDAQLRAIRAYAEKNDILLPEEYIFSDAGLSGRNADRRPAFMKMISLAKCKPRPFEVILVHKFDRFSRNREDSVVFKSLLRRECGVQVISVSERMEDDKFSVILEAMLEAMAEYYSLNLSEEVMKGMMEKARGGGILSKAPYGYRNSGSGGTPVIISDEAETVKMMFQKINSREMSPYTLARYLNNLCVATGKGKAWSVFSIKYILKNPFYTGLSVWNRQHKSTGRFKEKSEWITAFGNHEPIIDKDIFDAVQKILNEGTHAHVRHTVSKSHWLTGLLKCSACGSGLSAHGRSTYPFFQCSGYNKGKCGVSHYIPMHTLENIIIAAITEFIGHPEINAVYEKLATEVFKNDNEIAQINEKIKKAEDKLTRIKSAYASGIDTLDEYIENKKDILTEISRLKAEKEQIISNGNKDSADRTEPNFSRLPETLQSDSISYKEKSKIIKSIVKKIIFDKRNKTIEVYFFCM